MPVDAQPSEWQWQNHHPSVMVVFFLLALKTTLIKFYLKLIYGAYRSSTLPCDGMVMTANIAFWLIQLSFLGKVAFYGHSNCRPQLNKREKLNRQIKKTKIGELILWEKLNGVLKCMLFSMRILKDLMLRFSFLVKFCG